MVVIREHLLKFGRLMKFMKLKTVKLFENIICTSNVRNIENYI